MFNALETKCIEQIEITKAILQKLENIVESATLSRNEIRRFTVSSCVTRLYAVYEYFVDTISSDYLDTLAECVPYTNLADELKREYRNGISALLGKVDYAQYSTLVPEDIIKRYYEALTGRPDYRFVTEALTMHEQNLRLNTVEHLFSRLQMKGFRIWISSHILIKKMFADQVSKYEQLESELKNFIQLRNDASHGLLDDLEGRDNLLSYCDLISTLIKVYASFLRKSILVHQIEAGKASKIGTVTEVFSRNGACILVPIKGVKVKVGGVYCVLNNTDCTESVVGSIMLNNTKLGSVLTKVEGLEVGIKYNSEVKRDSIVYVYRESVGD
jgi:hypothetical protein